MKRKHYENGSERAMMSFCLLREIGNIKRHQQIICTNMSLRIIMYCVGCGDSKTITISMLG